MIEPINIHIHFAQYAFNKWGVKAKSIQCYIYPPNCVTLIYIGTDILVNVLPKYKWVMSRGIVAYERKIIQNVYFHNSPLNPHLYTATIHISNYIDMKNTKLVNTATTLIFHALSHYFDIQNIIVIYNAFSFLLFFLIKYFHLV